MLYIGTGVNPGYYGAMQSYGYLGGLERLNHAGRVATFCVLLDFSDEKADEVEWLHPGVRFVRMTSGELKTQNPKSCLQHGEFLAGLERCFDLKDDDSVLYTDADIRIQRRLTEDEMELLARGEVFVAMNWHDHETLEEEMTALQARVPLEDFDREFPKWREMRCFNTGVLGMRVQRWRDLFDLYCGNFKVIDPMLGHYAKQQWLLCWLLQVCKFPLLDPLSEAVRNIHCHGHHQRAPIDNRLQRGLDGVIHRDGTPILFAHRLG